MKKILIILSIVGTCALAFSVSAATVSKTVKGKVTSPFSNLIQENATVIHGTITAVNGTDVTVLETAFGGKQKRSSAAQATIVVHAANASTRSFGPGLKTAKTTLGKPTLSALSVGEKVMIMGVMQSNGSFDAKRVVVVPTAKTSLKKNISKK